IFFRNTGVNKSVKEAIDELIEYTNQIQRRLSKLEPKEYLWPFSNPPYIINEADVPIALFEGISSSKTQYREYLSNRYGRYKMTFSGIHVNFSFDEELLKKDFDLSDEKDYTTYKNTVYLTLAKRMVVYGWILVAISAASPILDGSYVAKGKYNEDEWTGMASVRCSEMGYWNSFAPVLDYSSIDAYAASIERYVNEGWIKAPSELYYPIRLKPPGENNLESLKKNGINHIELRMFDLNPLFYAGLNEKDVTFAHLLMVWLASTEDQPFSTKDQVQAVQNFKNAARYDLKTVKLLTPDDESFSVAKAARFVIGFMKEFYKDFPQEVQDVLNYQENKILYPENRYAWMIKDRYMN
ncbi:MAG: hypothetical protein HUJ53_02400, partial [Holdemanella sp.]|nr:hypothetical protein [Holdemanella sp.]